MSTGDGSKIVSVKTLPFGGTKVELKARGLDEKKYIHPDDWIVKVKAYFEQIGVTEIIEGESEPITNPITAEQTEFNEKWAKLEGTARNFLMQSCEGVPLQLIKSQKTADVMWKKLKNKYEPKNITSLMKLEGDFHKCRMENNYEDPLIWLSRLELIKAQIEEHPDGDQIKDSKMIAHIMTMLPKNLYETEIKNIQKGELNNYDDICPCVINTTILLCRRSRNISERRVESQEKTLHSMLKVERVTRSSKESAETVANKDTNRLIVGRIRTKTEKTKIVITKIKGMVVTTVVVSTGTALCVERRDIGANLSYHHLARAHIKSSVCILMELSSFEEVLFPKE
jgi:hypothetical protein